MNQLFLLILHKLLDPCVRNIIIRSLCWLLNLWWMTMHSFCTLYNLLRRLIEHFYYSSDSRDKKEMNPPVRGIDPRPQQWERRILATRPHGTCQRGAVQIDQSRGLQKVLRKRNAFTESDRMPRNLFGTWESTLDMGGAQVWGGSSGAVLLLRKEGPVRELNPGPLAP